MSITSNRNDPAAIGAALRTENDEPDIDAMRAELHYTCTHATDVQQQMLVNDRTIYCRWADQQDNGRKPGTDSEGNEPDPWGESSDVRVRMADELTNDQVKLMTVASRRASFNLKSSKGSTFEAAGKVRSYMNWLRNVRMRRNIRRETKLGARWRQVYGTAAMAITWHQEWAREYQTVTVGDLQSYALETPMGPAGQMLAALHEPDKDVMKELGGMLRQMYPDLSQGDALEQLNALRRTGQMSLPARYLRKNEPRWKALKWWVDIFGPLNMGEAQESPWLTRRAVLTPAQVMEKKISERWDEEFCDELVKHTGKSVLDWVGVPTGDMESDRRVTRDSAELMKGLCEVFYVYYRHADSDGVPCLYLTVMSPHLVKRPGDPMENLYAIDQPLGYDHGEYPIVLLQRETNEEQAHEARGTAEILITQQAEAKWMRDSRVNQTDLRLQPPVIRHERELGLPLAIRPRGQIGERRAASMREWTVPNTAPEGAPLENDARMDAYRYFGRNREEDPVRAGVYDQDLAETWCEELEECWAQTLKLAQQFENEVEFDRIVGGQAVNVRLSRADIQGEFDFGLLFNADTLDPERMEKKAALVQSIVAPLSGGAVDISPIVRGITAYLFPEFAEDALREGPAAEQAEIKDEQNNFTLIMAGVEPEMKENGQNFQLRLQWLQSQLSQPSTMKRLAQNPDSQELAEKRLQHLQFQTEQYTVNAQAGRVGVKAGPAAA